MLLIVALYAVLFRFEIDTKFLPTEIFEECFGMSCMNNGNLNLTTCLCNCPPGKTGLECEFDTNSLWPDDDFALPETVFGCPEPDVYNWRPVEVTLIIKRGIAKSKRQYWPELPHFRGPFQKENVTLNFCVKERRQIGGFVDTWPTGNYCIYKQHPCLYGMEEDDINLNGYELANVSTTLGPIPFIDVVSNNETSFVKLTVCCKRSEHVVETILPRRIPFMLLKASGSDGCQHVKGAEVKLEWFAFISNETDRYNHLDNGPLDIYHHNGLANLTYCFYKNYDRRECLHYVDTGASYRGRLNHTENGLPCSHWQDISGIQFSGILEKNYCRKITNEFGYGTSCYAKEGGQEVLKPCDLEYCHKLPDDPKFLYSNYPNIAYHRPLLSNVKNGKLKTMVNGLNWKGSENPNPPVHLHKTYQPWVRIDLGATYRIHGIILYRKKTRCLYPQTWTNIATWIHIRPYQFENFGANLCWEIEDLLEVCNIEMRCVQPLTGYYVTIQAFASALLDYEQSDGKEAHFEEIEVYGEETRCGQYFGIGIGKLWRFQIDTSMNKTTHFHFLHDEKAGDKADIVLNVK